MNKDPMFLSRGSGFPAAIRITVKMNHRGWKPLPHLIYAKMKLTNRCSFPEYVMFFNILPNFPGTGHSFGKGYQVACADFDRVSTLRCNNHIPFQKITGLGIIVGPGEF
jgi:hypothetical protein